MTNTQVEVLFFFVGVLPYWYTISLPEKCLRYWCLCIYCPVVWVIYFTYKMDVAALINNFVEIGIGGYGLRAFLKGALQK